MDHHDRAEPRQCQQKLGVAVIQMSSEPKVGGLIDDHIYALRNRIGPPFLDAGQVTGTRQDFIDAAAGRCVVA